MCRENTSALTECAPVPPKICNIKGAFALHFFSSKHKPYVYVSKPCDEQLDRDN